MSNFTYYFINPCNKHLKFGHICRNKMHMSKTNFKDDTFTTILKVVHNQKAQNKILYAL